MSLQEQINEKTNRIASLDAQIITFEKSAKAWQDSLIGRKCDQKLKGKRERCQADLRMRADKAREYLANASRLKTLKSTLQSDIVSLRKNQEAANKVSLLLAEDGISAEAEIAKVQAKAEVEKIKAEAEAEAIRINAENVMRIDLQKSKAEMAGEAKSQEEKSKMTTYVIAGVSLVLIIAGIIYFKSKK